MPGRRSTLIKARKNLQRFTGLEYIYIIICRVVREWGEGEERCVQINRHVSGDVILLYYIYAHSI